ncbi:uncharacterized protein [Haliotis cracherodii]|uniref:uncharacterized protein n=1 Tax=Haliotis cracherodii TaxID=6455 RepID=UPI0039E8CC6D
MDVRLGSILCVVRRRQVHLGPQAWRQAAHLDDGPFYPKYPLHINNYMFCFEVTSQSPSLLKIAFSPAHEWNCIGRLLNTQCHDLTSAMSAILHKDKDVPDIGLEDVDYRVTQVTTEELAELNGDLDPDLNGDLDPDLNGDLDPDRNGDLDPDRNGDLDPDLSPIEHIWDEMDWRHRRQPHVPRTLQELRNMLQQIRTDIPQDFVRRLVHSMRRRCVACIATRGGHTKLLICKLTFWHVHVFYEITHVLKSV